MPTIDNHTERRAVIYDIIRSKEIESQFQLLEELSNLGIAVTQSSISRDLEALGVAKIGGQYTVLAEDTDEKKLFGQVGDFVLSVATAGPALVVVKTVAGGAQRVAHTLDAVAWPEIVGTVAGDDTIFIATDSGSSQDVLMKRLERRLA